MKIICVLVAFFTGSLLVCSIKNVCMGRECAAHVRATQAIEENMSLFDQSMVPGHLDKVLEELEGLDDRDGQGNAAPEIRRYKLQNYFRLFRMITESVDASYLPRMYRILTGKGEKTCRKKSRALFPPRWEAPIFTTISSPDSGCFVFRPGWPSWTISAPRIPASHPRKNERSFWPLRKEWRRNFSPFSRIGRRRM